MSAVDGDALRRGFGPEVFATDRALELVAQGMPFRDAYHAVKANLDQLAGQNPDIALAAKRHLGAPAGLDFAMLDKEARKAAAWAAAEGKRFAAVRRRLLG